MFYLVSIFWILSITGLLVFLTKKSFNLVCAFSFILGTLVLYICCFFNQLRLGYYLSYLAIVLFWILIIRKTLKKDKEFLKEFINNYFTVGFFVFIILLIYSFILFKYKGYEFCDEFTHWGPMVISSLKVNGFYAQPQDILDFHQDYPPFFTLLECLWCGFDNFHFSETYTYIAINVFMFSCFLPVFDKLQLSKKKDILKAIIGLVCVLLVGLTISKTKTASDYAHVYTSIYVDWALAVFVAYTMFLIYREKEWKTLTFFSVGICLSAILLMKQIGIFFYLLVLFFIILKFIFINRELSRKKNILKGIVFFVLIPIAFYLSWKGVVNYYGLSGQFVINELNISEVLNIIKGNTDLEWKTITFYNFKEALLNRKIVLYPFEMSYFIAGLIISIFIFVGGNNMKESLIASLTYILGLLGYAIVMALLYILAFGIDEAPVLASFDRYMVCYLYFGIVLSLLLNLFKGFKKEYFTYVTIVLIVLLLFVEKKDVSEIIPTLSNNSSKNMKVLVVQQFGETEYHREKLNGFTMTFEPKYIMGGEFCNTEGYLSFNKTEEWIDVLSDYDLMYIEGYDDFFYEECWLPLEQDDNLSCYNGWLYSIEVNTNGKISLSYNDRDFMYYVRKYYMLNYEN